MTSYNGQAITYDALGNPLSYKGATLTWQGRNLMTYTTSEQRVEYSYDADGLRMTKKVYDSQNRLNKTYIYTWSDSKLVGYKLSYTFYTPNSNTPTSGTVTVKYLYDNDGETYGININGFDYYYVKDMQDNIVALISASSGKAVLLFDYTAYGIVTRTAPQDDETTLDSVADVSDFDDIFNQMQDLVFKMTTLVNCWLDSTLVYKDYSYDSDTGMYYLQSRYYDPEVGRFINADDTNILRDTTGTINGANLFAYCNNDPVFNSDPSGKWIKYRYINDQGARNIGSIKLGTKSNVRYAGCELVAIYNLLVYLKNAQSLQSIIRFAERHNMLYTKTGKLGTDPYRISRFLNYKKIKYKRVYSAKSCFKYAKSGKLCIISYWNNIRSYGPGIHTFFFYYSKSQRAYIIYNGYVNKAYTDRDVGKGGLYFCGYVI